MPRQPVHREGPHGQVRGDPTIEPRPRRASVNGHPDASLSRVTDGNSLSTSLTSFARRHLDEYLVWMCRVDRDVQRRVARRDG